MGAQVRIRSRAPGQSPPSTASLLACRAGAAPTFGVRGHAGARLAASACLPGRCEWSRCKITVHGYGKGGCEGRGKGWLL